MARQLCYNFSANVKPILINRQKMYYRPIISRISLIMFTTFILTACNTKNSWTCDEGNCENGEGKRVWADNGFEKGHWISGKLNGEGTQSFGTTSEFAGDTYSGNFKNGKYEGHGTYYDKSEDCKYVGEWADGKPNGKGISKWGEKSKFPGRYYDGDWKDGLMHGYGTKFWGKAEVETYTNNKYVGEWKNDKMDGFGRYEWADGSFYEGPWKDGEQNGDGIYVFNDGEIFKGHWEDGYCEALAKKMGLE